MKAEYLKLHIVCLIGSYIFNLTHIRFHVVYANYAKFSANWYIVWTNENTEKSIQAPYLRCYTGVRPCVTANEEPVILRVSSDGRIIQIIYPV